MLGNSSTTDTKVEISLFYNDNETARSILKAITPDNLNIPTGITISAGTCDSNLSLKIVSKRSLSSLIVTIDDLLSCIQAAEKALEEIV